jgi:hypothetical protein
MVGTLIHKVEQQCNDRMQQIERDLKMHYKQYFKQIVRDYEQQFDQGVRDEVKKQIDEWLKDMYDN